MTYKIGIDFHGVISNEPDKFKVFCHEIRKKGVLVYIISGGPEKDIVKYLDKYGVEYDKVWAIFDHYDKQGKVTRFKDGSFQVPTELWNKAKAEYCMQEGIAFHIDDSTVYGKYFDTPYCLYDTFNGACALNKGEQVDFRKPESAAEQVFLFLMAH